MAEAAALALAALVTDKLGFQQVHFLSDSQQLVHFLNAQDRSNPPQWRIKYYTHMFINSMANRNIRTWKIQRTQN
jgi:ribonuclease HI